MKRVKEILSYILIAATFFTSILFQPLDALADMSQQSQYLSSLNDIWSANDALPDVNGKIIGEDASRREANAKHFIRADKLREAAVYPFNIHYLEDGEWVDIDNRLELVTLEDGTQAYKNASNAFEVYFSTAADGNELVRIVKDEYSVSWSVSNASTSPARLNQDGGSAGDPRLLPNLVSSITYPAATGATTITYNVLPGAVREYIEITSKQADAPIYSMTLKCANVSPTVQEDGRIIMQNASGEDVFTISAPYMTDANGVISTDVETSLQSGSNDEYTYTLSPSTQWLNDSQRAYPVVIDPDVITDLTQTAIYDTYVDEEFGDENFYLSSQLKVGELGGYEHLSYVKFAQLPTLQSGDVVVSANLNLIRAQTGESVSKQIDLYTVTSQWESATVTWNSKPSLGTKIESFGFTNAQLEATAWDITNLVKRWYLGEANNGLALKESPVNGSFTEYYASEMSNAAIRPAAAICYTNSTGVESVWSYHQQNIGRAGTGYVNDYNGNLVLAHEDVSTAGNIMPASVTHVFNGDTKSISGAYGKGWMVNYAQTLKHVNLSGKDYYEHVDGDGTRHYFKEDPENNAKFVHENDPALTLTVTASAFTIEDSQHNKSVFDGSGRLIKTIDQNENELNIAYDRSGNITSVVDGMGNTIAFEYVNRRLNKVSANGLSVQYTYDAQGRLIKAAYSDGKVSDYAYDANDNLITVQNHDGYRIAYGYTARAPYRVTSVSESGGDLQGCGLTFEYGWNMTRMTDSQGRVNIYQFDNHGQIVSVRDAHGSAQYASYDNHPDRQSYLSAISKLQKTSLNMLMNPGFESGGAWQRSDGTLISGADLTTQAYIGANGLKLTAGKTYYQTLSLEPGKTYTVSGYFKGGAGAVLTAAYFGNKNVPVESVSLNTDEIILTVDNTAQLYATISPSNATDKNIQWTSSNPTAVSVDAEGVVTAVSGGSAIITAVAGGHSASCVVEAYQPPIPVTGISLDQTTLAMRLNSTAKLTAAILPSDATNKSVVWTSSNPRYVRVDGDGQLTSFTRAGTAVITATTVDGGFTASCTVTVGDEVFMQDVGKITYHDFDGVTTDANTDWNRYSYTFTVPENVKSDSVRIKVTLPAEASGETYADCLTLEKADGAGRLNLIEDGDFTNGLSAWKTVGTERIRVAATDDELHPSEFSGGVVSITGSPASAARVYQNVRVSGAANDRFTFGGWMKSNTVPSQTHNEVEYGVRKLTATFYNGNTEVNSCDVYFTADCDTWQYVCGAAIAEGAFDSITLAADYSNNCNTAEFDGLQLYKDAFCEYYRYNDSGELEESEDVEGETTQYEYDDNGNLICETDPDGKVTTYTYDSHNNMLTMTAPDGLSYAYTYDEYGNSTSSKSIDSQNPASFMLTSSAYTANGAFPLTDTDSYGNSAGYDYDPSSGTLKSVADGNGNTTNYTYDAMNRLTGASAGGTNARITYGYSGDNITSISHNGFNDGLSYDAFGNVVGVNVNGNEMTEYSYDYTRGVLARTAYGNGFDEHYIYDALDRVTEIKHGAATVYRYAYDGEGNLASLENCLTGVITRHFYNSEGTLMRSTASDGTQRRYEYLDGDLAKIEQTAGGVSWTTEYAYDDDGNPEKITLNSGVTITDSQSIFGMKTTRTYKNAGGTSILDVAMTYLKGANDSQSDLLGSYQNGAGDAYVYTYDGNGNITGITYGDETVSYVYDKLNQLTRENNSATNTTTLYNYDAGGNILSKKEYDYTLSDFLPMVPRDEYRYTYDGAWKDLLVNYNGEYITYDAIGNPLDYRGYEMVWSGRQLRQMKNDDDNLAFTYDENGMRVGKRVITITGNRGTLKNTSYTYADSQLASEVRTGTNGAAEAKLLYSYDTEGTLVSVNYNGTEYYYLRNGQGDVVGLIDGSGDAVVEYTYDSWGKLLTTTGTLATTLGKDNPFRYRGYYYDNETGLYYLQSRYYDPETGRFINADDVAFLGATGTLLSCNLFAYCENNAVNRSDHSGYISIGAIIGGIIGFGVGAIIVPIFADLLKLKGWARTVFIAAGVVAVTAIGALLGYYAGKALVSLYAKGGAFATKLNTAVAKVIAKFTGASIKSAAGNGWTLTLKKYTIRIMAESGGRVNYFRISHATKGAMTIAGAFSSNRALTHVPITINNLVKLIKMMIGWK